MTEAESFSDLSQRLKDTLEALPHDLEEAERDLAEFTLTGPVGRKLRDARDAMLNALDEAEHVVDASAVAMAAASDALAALSEAAAEFSGEVARCAAACESEALAEVSAASSKHAVLQMQASRTLSNIDTRVIRSLRDLLRPFREMTESLSVTAQEDEEDEH